MNELLAQALGGIVGIILGAIILIIILTPNQDK